MKKVLAALALLFLFSAACTSVDTPQATATLAAASPSSTPALPSPTVPPPSPTPTATVTPLEGLVTAQINVRTAPSTQAASLGLVDAGQRVQVVGREAAGLWYAVLFPTGPQGRGWVAAAYVQVQGAESLPVLSGAAGVTTTPGGNAAHVTQRINVRSGPATSYDVLGTLEPEAVVVLTGRNETGSWFQIEYIGGPNGRGWVTAAYVRADDTAGLPMVDAGGAPITPRPDLPTPLAVPPSPTVGPALTDGDSSASPGARLTFTPDGARQFSYTSDLSAPQGDLEDWIEFTPYAAGGNARLYLSLACSGNATLAVELWQNGILQQGAPALACGSTDLPLLLPAGQAFQLRLRAVEQDGLRYCRYTLTVRNGP